MKKRQKREVPKVEPTIERDAEVEVETAPKSAERGESAERVESL